MTRYEEIIQEAISAVRTLQEGGQRAEDRADRGAEAAEFLQRQLAETKRQLAEARQLAAETERQLVAAESKVRQTPKTPKNPTEQTFQNPTVSLENSNHPIKP
jgi:hypothetical protein